MYPSLAAQRSSSLRCLIVRGIGSDIGTEGLLGSILPYSLSLSLSSWIPCILENRIWFLQSGEANAIPKTRNRFSKLGRYIRYKMESIDLKIKRRRTRKLKFRNPEKSLCLDVYTFFFFLDYRY